MNAEKDKVRVYGQKGALSVEPFTTPKGFNTVVLDVATMDGDKANWGNKISIQLTEAEFPEVVATLLGWSNNYEGRHHGPEKNKGFKIEHQGTHVYLAAYGGNMGKHAVRIDGSGLMHLCALMIRQALREYPHITSDSYLAILKNTIGRASHHKTSLSA